MLDEEEDWNGSGGEVWMGGQEEVTGDDADMGYISSCSDIGEWTSKVMGTG